ncbi:MAG: cell envelope integrity protein TolA [Proteobacteria bacterium]|nr:cell envelope integrity protein TolA [Pseudomonadota bacterium]
MESAPAKARAVAGSLAIHALIAFVLYWGWLMQPEIRNAGGDGPAIEATLVSAPQPHAASARRQPEPRKPEPPKPAPPTPEPVTPQPPKPQPVTQPRPRQMLSQSQLPKPDTVDQDEIRRNAQLAAERQQKEQDERRRQAQIDLDRKQQQVQAENRQRQQQADAIAKQLAIVKAQRAEAERQEKLQAQKLQQIEDMRKQLAQNTATPKPAARNNPSPSAGNNGDSGLLGKYKQAMNEQANLNWIHADAPEQVHCRVHVTQIPGGEVIAVKFTDCPFDAAARDSVERALQKTPLPYAGYEHVFQRQIDMDFCYPTEQCKQ